MLCALDEHLIPPNCNPADIELRPYLYYELASEERGKVLQVAVFGYCDCEESHSMIMVNGVWFQATPYFYELVWPFLPDMVKDEYAGILERLQED